MSGVAPKGHPRRLRLKIAAYIRINMQVIISDNYAYTTSSKTRTSSAQCPGPESPRTTPSTKL